MPLTSHELLELHAKAVRNLGIKHAHIPARIFPTGRKPTIRDIYERPHTLENPVIHYSLQLDFVFPNYNSFAVAGFRARKPEQAMNITMAIFYWQMDQQHSFASQHNEMRFNVILAHIVLSHPDAHAELNTQLKRFLEHYLGAWLDNDDDQTRDYFIARIWKTGPYDFVRWTSKPRKRMSTSATSCLRGRR